jgi:hypothetical protein
MLEYRSGEIRLRPPVGESGYAFMRLHEWRARITPEVIIERQTLRSVGRRYFGWRVPSVAP